VALGFLSKRSVEVADGQQEPGRFELLSGQSSECLLLTFSVLMVPARGHVPSSVCELCSLRRVRFGKAVRPSLGREVVVGRRTCGHTSQCSVGSSEHSGERRGWSRHGTVRRRGLWWEGCRRLPALSSVVGRPHVSCEDVEGIC